MALITLGPASMGSLPSLIPLAHRFRLNAAHCGGPEGLRTWLKLLDGSRRVVVDVQGIKRRLSSQCPAIHEIPSDHVRLVLESDYKGQTEDVFILPCTTFAGIGDSQIQLNDGHVVLDVIKKTDTHIDAIIQKNGPCGPNKGITVELREYQPSKIDLEMIRVALEFPFTDFALSFVQDGSEAEILRPLIGGRKLSAKIETPNAIKHLENISQSFDEIWLCRGDLGAEGGLDALWLYQREFEKYLHACPCILAGEVLGNLVHAKYPSRTEIVALYEAHDAGWRGFVLSDETTIGNVAGVIEFLSKLSMDWNTLENSYDSIIAAKQGLGYGDISDTIVEFCGVVKARRRHGRRLAFLDVGLDDKQVQILCNQDNLYVWATARSTIWVKGRVGLSNTGWTSIYPVEIKLIRTVPEPGPVLRVLQLWSAGTFTAEEAAQALQIDDVSELARLFSSRRLGAHCRRMRGEPPKRMRTNPRSILPHELALIDEYEHEYASKFPIKHAKITPEMELELDFLKDDLDESRLVYIEQKKKPQIKWMTFHLRKFKFKHILDVGGGRGDLACVLGREFPDAQITVIDRNETSLVAGETRAKNARLSNVHFINSDIVDLSPDATFDLVIGLHACGGLTDFLIDFAMRCSASFMVVPCCFNKNKNLAASYIPSVLTEIAESTVSPVNRRAMHSLNAMRLSHVGIRTEILTMPAEITPMNMVLLGYH